MILSLFVQILIFTRVLRKFFRRSPDHRIINREAAGTVSVLFCVAGETGNVHKLVWGTRGITTGAFAFYVQTAAVVVAEAVCGFCTTSEICLGPPTDQVTQKRERERVRGWGYKNERIIRIIPYVIRPPGNQVSLRGNMMDNLLIISCRWYERPTAQKNQARGKKYCHLKSLRNFAQHLAFFNGLLAQRKLRVDWSDRIDGNAPVGVTVGVLVLVDNNKNTLLNAFPFNGLITRRIHRRALGSSLFLFNCFYLDIPRTIIITIIPNIITMRIIGYLCAARNLQNVNAESKGYSAE